MSLAWATLALVVGLMAGEAVAIVLARTNVSDYGSIFRDGHPVGASLYVLATAITVTILVFAVRPLRWSAPTYLGLVRPHGHFVFYTLVWSVLPVLLVATHSMQFDLGELHPHGLDRARIMNELILNSVLLVIAAPVAEEIIFRGFLYRGLSESRLGVVGAIVVTALIWTLLHYGKSTAGMIDTMLCGLAWGWLRWHTGSTWPAIACHVAYNGAMSLTIIAKLNGWLG
jgi:membrane protease YdiL (CAAX protease family)